MKGFIEIYNETEINSKDSMYAYISNYNKFQAAKDKGEFEQSLENFMKFLKYERLHADRDLVVHRLFNLAMSEYKEMVAQELFNARGDN